jgi:hypothetical protein
MLELFVQMACQCVKPEQIDVLLLIWRESADWNSKAKNFVTDKLKKKALPKKNN